MKKAVGLASALVMTLSIAAFARAQEPAPIPGTKEEAVRELTKITGAASLGRMVMDQMREAFQKSIPDMPASFWDNFMAEVRSEEMEDMLVPIYSKHFTLDELKQLIVFYKTPLGQKVIAEMPVVMKECMTAGEEWGRKIGDRAYRKAEQQRSKTKS